MAPQVHWNLKIGAKKTKQWWIRLQKDVMNPPASRTIKSTDGSDHFFSCGLRLNATLRNTVQDFSYIGSSQQEARRSFRVEFACSACVCMANSLPSLTATSCISSFISSFSSLWWVTFSSSPSCISLWLLFPSWNLIVYKNPWEIRMGEVSRFLYLCFCLFY